MQVVIPGPLRSYTDGASRVEAQALALDELLRKLDLRFPGLRFRIVDEQDRIREHIRIFVGGEQETSLDRRLDGREEIQIVCALSGG